MLHFSRHTEYNARAQGYAYCCIDARPGLVVFPRFNRSPASKTAASVCKRRFYYKPNHFQEAVVSIPDSEIVILVTRNGMGEAEPALDSLQSLEAKGVRLIL